VSHGLPPRPDLLVGDAAPPTLVLALDAAGRLEHELGAVVGLLNDRTFAVARGAVAAAITRSLESVVETVRLLRQSVLDTATRGADAVPTIRERAIRARVNVVIRAIHVLQSREHDVPGPALVAPFRCVRDVCVFLVDRFAQIYEGFAEHATDHEFDTGARHRLRYIAVDDAEIAFARLGREPALAHFLRGCATSHSDEVRGACREIAVTLGLALATTSDADAKAARSFDH